MLERGPNREAHIPDILKVYIGYKDRCCSRWDYVMEEAGGMKVDEGL